MTDNMKIFLEFKLKNTNTVLENGRHFTIKSDHASRMLVDQTINNPIYLIDAFDRHVYFIQEQRRNIEDLGVLLSHMKAYGKICPKAWHWGRFYKLYHPMYESHWLSSWWDKTDEEKMHRFRQQLDYLATQTLRFKDANDYLMGIEDKSWYYNGK